jgi:phosphate transport system substrate-binding protein
VRRSDGSGTTFVFTQHLSAINPEWAKGPGGGTAVEFPVGVGGRKNDGVAALIQQTPGAIGYLEYAYAVASDLPMAALENARGRFVGPTMDAFTAALDAVALPSDLRAWLFDPLNEAAYPIVSYTWLLARQSYADPDRAAALKDLLGWCLGPGQLLSKELHYVPLPTSVVAAVRAKVDTIH